MGRTLNDRFTGRGIIQPGAKAGQYDKPKPARATRTNPTTKIEEEIARKNAINRGARELTRRMPKK